MFPSQLTLKQKHSARVILREHVVETEKLPKSLKASHVVLPIDARARWPWGIEDAGRKQATPNLRFPFEDGYYFPNSRWHRPHSRTVTSRAAMARTARSRRCKDQLSSEVLLQCR